MGNKILCLSFFASLACILLIPALANAEDARESCTCGCTTWGGGTDDDLSGYCIPKYLSQYDYTPITYFIHNYDPDIRWYINECRNVFETGCSAYAGCCGGKCFDLATEKCCPNFYIPYGQTTPKSAPDMSGLICGRGQTCCDRDKDGLSDTCIPAGYMCECPAQTTLGECKSCSCTAMGCDVQNEPNGVQCNADYTGGKVPGRCFGGACYPCPSDPENDCMKCECDDTGCHDTLEPDGTRCTYKEYVSPEDMYFSGLAPAKKPSGTYLLEGNQQPVEVERKGECISGVCRSCPSPQSFGASLSADGDASMVDITGEWFPLLPDASVETNVELNDVRYDEGSKDHYAGLPKTIIMRMKIGVAYYDWTGGLDVNLFGVFRVRAVNAIKVLGDKMGISNPPLYKSLISNKEINDKIPSTGEDDSRWIEENLELKITINPNGKEIIEVADGADFYHILDKKTNARVDRSSPFDRITPRKAEPINVEIPYATIMKVVMGLKENINYNIEAMSSDDFKVRKNVIYDGTLIDLNLIDMTEYGSPQNVVGDGSFNTVTIEHRPLIDWNGDPYGIVDENDVVVEKYRGWFTRWKPLNSEDPEYPFSLDPGTSGRGAVITLAKPPASGQELRIKYKANTGSVAATIKLHIIKVNRQLDELRKFLENMEKCVQEKGDSSRRQAGDKSNPGEIRVEGGKSVYLLREPAFFRLDGTAYQIFMDSGPLKNVTKTFILNPDDFVNMSNAEVYRYEDSEIASKCNVTTLGSASYSVSAGQQSVNSSDNMLVLGFRQGTFASATNARINLMRLDCTAVTSDMDSDGVLDDVDNCFFTYNPDQADGNGNGIGDACDVENPPLPAADESERNLAMEVIVGYLRQFFEGSAGMRSLVQAIFYWSAPLQ